MAPTAGGAVRGKGKKRKKKKEQRGGFVFTAALIFTGLRVLVQVGLVAWRAVRVARAVAAVARTASAAAKVARVVKTSTKVLKRVAKLRKELKTAKSKPKLEKALSKVKKVMSKRDADDLGPTAEMKKESQAVRKTAGKIGAASGQIRKALSSPPRSGSRSLPKRTKASTRRDRVIDREFRGAFQTVFAASAARRRKTQPRSRRRRGRSDRLPLYAW